MTCYSVSLCILRSLYNFLWIYKTFCDLLWFVTTDYSFWKSLLLLDNFISFLLIFCDFLWFSMIFYDFLWFFVIFCDFFVLHWKMNTLLSINNAYEIIISQKSCNFDLLPKKCPFLDKHDYYCILITDCFGFRPSEHTIGAFRLRSNVSDPMDWRE